MKDAKPLRRGDTATITIRQEGAAVAIEYGWPQSASRPYLGFGGVLLAVALFEILLKHAIVPCVVFGLIGIGLTYNGLKLSLNKTLIEADAANISVSSGPMPAGFRRVIPAVGITDIFMARVLAGKRSLVEPPPTIFLLDESRTPTRLVDAVPTAEVASHIRHTLLEFYGLPDSEAN